MVLVNLPQLFIDSILTGSVLALGAIGLTHVYRVMKFPNFVHAEFLTFGAYSAYAVNQYLGLGLFAGSISSFVASGLLAVISYRFVFSKLENVSSSGTTTKLTSMLIASIGLGFIFRHSIQKS